MLTAIVITVFVAFASPTLQADVDDNIQSRRVHKQATYHDYFDSPASSMTAVVPLITRREQTLQIRPTHIPADEEGMIGSAGALPAISGVPRMPPNNAGDLQPLGEEVAKARKHKRQSQKSSSVPPIPAPTDDLGVMPNVPGTPKKPPPRFKWAMLYN